MKTTTKLSAFVYMGFIICVSGVQAEQETVCAVKASSVDLLCSDQHHTTSKKWFIIHKAGRGFLQSEVNADRNDKYNVSDNSNFTLTINNVTESDAKIYCCSETENPQTCWDNGVNLQVTDLQVKVVPSTRGQTVTLVCSTSCDLKKYTWFKNGKFLYEDPSPWYQELVSSDAAVTYSCGVKGHRGVRAPDVSVASVTSSCFKVTYATGRTCPQQESVDESCSITYPTEVRVQTTPADQGHVRLTCNTSCSLSDPPTAFTWYKNRQNHKPQQSPHPSSSPDSFSCAVRGHERLLSEEVCVAAKKCWTVNYVSRSICALQGSSVNISSEYSHPENQQPNFKRWYKIKRHSKKEPEKLKEAAGQVEHNETTKNHHILTLKKLKKNDSAEYAFRVHTDEPAKGRTDLPGVTLVVTDLRVKFAPSQEVTEGDRVSLTCATSCPLTDNTNYIWFLNEQPLTPKETQNKHLVLDPVSSNDAGNYSCGVNTHENRPSRPKTLTVQRASSMLVPVAAGAAAVVLVIIGLTVGCWIRRKRTYGQSPRAETSNNTQQRYPEPVYDSPDPDPPNPADLYYSKVQFSENHRDPLYSSIHLDELQAEHVPYAVVRLKSNATCDYVSG